MRFVPGGDSPPTETTRPAIAAAPVPPRGSGRSGSRVQRFRARVEGLHGGKVRVEAGEAPADRIDTAPERRRGKVLARGRAGPRAPAEGPEVEREHAVGEPGARAAADDPDSTVGCGGRRSRGALLRRHGQLAPAAAVEQEGGAERISGRPRIRRPRPRGRATTRRPRGRRTPAGRVAGTTCRSAGDTRPHGASCRRSRGTRPRRRSVPRAGRRRPRCAAPAAGSPRARRRRRRPRCRRPTRASYPSQATSRIASAASDASATVTTFAIRSRRSVTAESPDDPATAPLSGVLPTASPSRAMM